MRDREFYLSPAKDCTQTSLRRLMKGDMLYFNCTDFEVIKIHQYKGLKVSDILKFLQLKLTSIGINLNTIMTKSQIKNV